MKTVKIKELEKLITNSVLELDNKITDADDNNRLSELKYLNGVRDGMKVVLNYIRDIN